MAHPSSLQTNNTGRFQAEARFIDSINMPWFMAPSPKKATVLAPGCKYCAENAKPAAVGPSAPTIPEDAIKLFCPTIGRFAEPIEMGRVLVMLGSDLAGFVSGVNLPVDFGYCGEVAMGQRDNLMNIS